MQHWTTSAKTMGRTPWSRHSQRPCQGSPSILLFELVLCIALPGVDPGKIGHCWIISWVQLWHNHKACLALVLCFDLATVRKSRHALQSGTRAPGICGTLYYIKVDRRPRVQIFCFTPQSRCELHNLAESVEWLTRAFPQDFLAVWKY